MYTQTHTHKNYISSVYNECVFLALSSLRVVLLLLKQQLNLLRQDIKQQ